MQKRISFKATFQKAFDKLVLPKQQLVLKALEALTRYFTTHQAPYGLRITQLYGRGLVKTFEARVSSDLRVVWVETQEAVVFALVGSHEEVRRFIKNL